MKKRLQKLYFAFMFLAALGLAAPFTGDVALDDASADEVTTDTDENTEAQVTLPPPRHRVAPPRRRRRRRRNRRRKNPVYLGIGGVGTFVLQGDSGVTELVRSGGGFNVFLGTRVSPYWGVELGLGVSMHNTERSGGKVETNLLSNASIDGKVFLAPKSTRLEPFLQIGAGYYSLFSDGFSSSELTGLGVHFGGGIDLRLNPAIAIGARALYKGIYVNNYEEQFWGVPPESAFMNTINGEVNVQFYF